MNVDTPFRALFIAAVVALGCSIMVASAVHFLRFELDAAALRLAKGGAALRFGVSHPAYSEAIEVPEPVRLALLADLD